MGVTQKPAVFETTDGEEFESEQAARQHQKLIDAARDLKDAERHYGSLLAETQKTADGLPFTWGYRTYWTVKTIYGEPQMEEFVVSSGVGTAIHDGVLHLSYGFNPKRTAEVGDLYADRDNAIIQLIKKLEQFKDGVSLRIRELEAKLG